MAWRNLKANEGNLLPRRIIFFDTETLPERTAHSTRLTHYLRLGCAEFGVLEAGRWTRVKLLNFSTAEEFWVWAIARGTPRGTTWIVSHGAVFDLATTQFPLLWESGAVVDDKPRAKRAPTAGDGTIAPPASLVVLEDPPTIIGFRAVASGSRFIVVDTLNYFREPLAAMGETVGLPKLPMPEFSASNEDWFTYCRRDCDILREAFLGLVKFVAEQNLGNFGKTAPSQAMNAFRHRFMRHKIVQHDRRDVRALERDAYFGGECRVFYLGPIRATVHQLDVAGLFPSAMLYSAVPWRLLRWEIRDEPLPLAPAIDPARTIAEVVVNSPSETFPWRKDGRVSYLCGRFRTCLCGPELAYAVDKGYVIEWGRWAEYATIPLFTAYVEHFWRLRSQFRAAGNKLYDRLCKLLLNSLYGKFGQLGSAWIDRPELLPERPWSQWVELDCARSRRRDFRAVGWRAQERVAKQEIDGAFPAISAFITSAARQRMRELRRTAGVHDVYYQGVDSLIVSQEAFLRLLAAGEVAHFELGKLRFIDSAEVGGIWGKQHYTLGQRDIISGVQPSGQRIDRESWQQERFGRAAALFSNGGERQLQSNQFILTRKQEGTGKWLAVELST